MPSEASAVGGRTPSEAARPRRRRLHALAVGGCTPLEAAVGGCTPSEAGGRRRPHDVGGGCTPSEAARRRPQSFPTPTLMKQLNRLHLTRALFFISSSSLLTCTHTPFRCLNVRAEVHQVKYFSVGIPSFFQHSDSVDHHMSCR